MTMKRKRKSWKPDPKELAEWKRHEQWTPAERKAFNTGFWDGDVSNYFPCLPEGPELAAYDEGFEGGKKYGPRKGKPWTLPELMKLQAEMKAEKRKGKR
jgi:hypothetical protein